MQDKAFAVLDAIRRGTLAEVPDRGPWLKAFQTVRWACDSPNGMVLTSDGRRALSDMGRAWRSGARPAKVRGGAFADEEPDDRRAL